MTEMDQTGLIGEEVRGGLCILTLGGGAAHALSRAMIAALHDSVRRAVADSDVKVIVLHGPGRIFCAGHDLKEIAWHRREADAGLAYLTTLFTECGEMMQALAGAAKPTLAVVEGVATAGGLQLMASCDLVFAGAAARFCLPGVSNGGFCTTPSVAVGRRIARGPLMELALSGEMMDSDWAQRVGLVNRVTPGEAVLDTALDFAAKLATRHAPAVAAGKAALDAQLALPLREAYALAGEVMIGHFMDPKRIAKDLADWS